MGRLPSILCCVRPQNVHQDETDGPSSPTNANSMRPHFNTINLILLGTAGSGKSTIFKQFDKQFESDLFATEKSKCKAAIEKYIQASFTKYTRLLPPDFELGSEEHNSLAEQLQDSNLSEEIFDNLDESIINRLADLWAKMKEVPHLPLCQKDTDYFFMEKLQLCLQHDYVPSDNDYLRCRVETMASETRRYDNVTIGKHNYSLSLTDVRGNKDDRRSWFASFESVDYFFYVSSLADYNLKQEEDSTKNRLVDSLETFGDVITEMKQYPTFRNKSVIVLLNKEDSFFEKLQADPLENYFTKFRPSRPGDPKEAREYVKHLFNQVARKQGFDVTKLDVKFTSAIDKKFGDKIIHSLLRSIVVQIFS